MLLLVYRQFQNHMLMAVVCLIRFLVLSHSKCAACQGQGMTVGLMGSQLLAQCVEAQLKGTAGQGRQAQLAALEGLPAKFHTQLGALVDYPWTLSCGPDAQCARCLLDLPSLSYTGLPA